MQGEWIRKPNKGTSIVFVHGILSSGETCWKNSNGAYWPDLLKEEPEIAATGIYVYTYQTGVYSGTYSIGDIVDDLKERVKLDGVLDNQQIIFVCHSMGGIVVRKFIVERILDLKKSNCALGTFLVASPSLGSDYANYIKLLVNQLSHAQAKALGFSQDNNWLNDLDKEFKNIKESGELNLQGKELLEDKPIFFKKLFTKQIVEPFSAARYFGDPYKVPGSDHFSIAKPVNEQAIQHRLLVDFIKKMMAQHASFSNAASVFYSGKAQITAASQVKDPSAIFDTIPKSVHKWQQKLIQRLAEQFKNEELNVLLNDFASKLRADFSELPPDWDGIAGYLVMGPGDRHKQIGQFLSSAKKFAEDKSKKAPITNLMAYLLQILVRQCHQEDDKGLSHVPVDQIHTVKLVGAARTTVPYVPSVSQTDSQEHENGKKSDVFQNIGYFLPETGELENADHICQAIAHDLLISLGEFPTSKDSQSLKKLSDILSAYPDDPENAPIQGLYVNQGSGHNPLLIDDVAAGLRKVLGDLLWIYIYGGQKDSSEWIYAEEGKIGGLISRFNREILELTPSQQNSQKHPGQEKTEYSIFVSYSSDDKAFVSALVGRLIDSGFKVVMDATHLKSGGEIEQFIHQSIKDTNATLCIISRSSLLSPWVAMETVNTFHLQEGSEDKKFIACYLEDDFFKPAFRIEATKMIDQKIAEIDANIEQYKELKLDSIDLNDEKTRLFELRNNLGAILQRLKNSLSLDVRPESLETSLERLRKDLLRN